jgi:hypothetical protein
MATSSADGAAATASSTTVAASNDNSKGIGPGAAAGIGVACTVVGLCVLGAVLYLLFRKRKRARGGGVERPRNAISQRPAMTGTEGQTDLRWVDKQDGRGLQQKYGGEAETRVHELENERARQELEGSQGFDRGGMRQYGH